MRRRWFTFGTAAAVSVLLVIGCLLGITPGNGRAAEPEPGSGASELSGEFAVVQGALSGGGTASKLKTKNCPTQAAFSGGRVRPPASVSVSSPRSAGPLVAYAASNGTLLPAPPKWECTASVGVDGSETIGAGPAGSVQGGNFPHLRQGGPSVQATLVPACEGCIASLICSFFPQAGVVKVYESFDPCEDRPRGELRHRISRSAVLFVDPPGAAGSGTALPTIGVTTYKRATGARQLNCTLPASEVNTCGAAIVAFIDFGRRR
jgi:hypothetical protein